MMRLILTPAQTPGRFTARLEDGTSVCVSHQPLVDGARVLLKQGFEPQILLTLRHEGQAYDSFVPRSIEAWAQDSYSESDRGGLRREKWRPYLRGDAA